MLGLPLEDPLDLFEDLSVRKLAWDLLRKLLRKEGMTRVNSRCLGYKRQGEWPGEHKNGSTGGESRLVRSMGVRAGRVRTRLPLEACDAHNERRWKKRQTEMGFEQWEKLEATAPRLVLTLAACRDSGSGARVARRMGLSFPFGGRLDTPSKLHCKPSQQDMQATTRPI